jgi:hypothetical protein
LNYTEGDCFVLPLRRGGYARGVIARMNGKGGIFGYFFGPRAENEADLILDEHIKALNSILVAQFGDLGLLKGEWRVVGHIRPWIRKDWPMPPFLRVDEVARIGFLSYYDENTLECVREDRVDLSHIDAAKYPRDSTLGYGAVEIVLGKLLSS